MEWKPQLVCSRFVSSPLVSSLLVCVEKEKLLLCKNDEVEEQSEERVRFEVLIGDDGGVMMLMMTTMKIGLALALALALKSNNK